MPAPPGPPPGALAAPDQGHDGADANRVPAGGALAVDRTGFSGAVQAAIEANPSITILRAEVTELPVPGAAGTSRTFEAANLLFIVWGIVPSRRVIFASFLRASFWAFSMAAGTPGALP